MKKIMAVTSKYESEGKEKAVWTRIGTLFEKDGKTKIKLDAIPINTEGWFHVFEDEKVSGKTDQTDDLDDDVSLDEIPF